MILMNLWVIFILRLCNDAVSTADVIKVVNQ